ncbi:hypothetical protein CC80DRAFT_591946 [Byssothecium circinans]|uniref:Uncharacterized protein n=1 Tax=Byssothecium circinans TaxID=147558 RepID=A0A6A5TZY0_9PLEO|nr:hypothetical protein CC80DRAFT_591946 [Byssothecium circinans]
MSTSSVSTLGKRRRDETPTLESTTVLETTAFLTPPSTQKKPRYDSPVSETETGDNATPLSKKHSGTQTKNDANKGKGTATLFTTPGTVDEQAIASPPIEEDASCTDDAALVTDDDGEITKETEEDAIDTNFTESEEEEDSKTGDIELFSRTQAAHDLFKLAPLPRQHGQFRFPVTIAGHYNLTIPEIDQLDDEEAIQFLADLADSLSQDTIPTDFPGLREELTSWASAFRDFPYDCANQPLRNCPMSFITTFQPKGIELKTWAAVTFHLWDREPEVPGSKYRFRWGIQKHKSICEVVALYGGEKYLDWLKSQKIPLQRGQEDLAEGIEFYHRCQLAHFERDHPTTTTSRLPQLRHYRQFEGERFVDLSDDVLASLSQQALWLQMHEGLAPGHVRDAICWKRMHRLTNRWNWNDAGGRRMSHQAPVGLGELAWPLSKNVEEPEERRQRD